MIRILFLIGIFLLFTSGAMGEYYQYTDDSGNVRFTDDMTQIPASQRKDAATYESEVSSGGDIEFGNAYSDEAPDSGPVDVDIPEAYAVPAGETFEVRATELNTLQAELNKTRQDLEKEQVELQAQAPGEEDANGKGKIAYRMKVDQLNAKIEQYGKDLKAFEEKVKSFNNRGRQGPK